MGFDDLFENHSSHHKYGHYGEHDHHRSKGYGYDSRQSHHDSVKSYYLSHFLSKIKNNRRLRIWVSILGIILFAIVLALIIILIPLIVKLINFVSQYGIQGVVESVSGFIDKIWKGAVK